MKSKLSTALALIVALLLALATPADEGGGNGGGTGVWILPACAFVNSGSLGPVQAPRLVIRSPASADLKMRVSSEMGNVSASFVDGISGNVIGLPAAGVHVTLPRSLLQTLSVAGGNGNVLVSDAQQRGYVMSLTIVAGEVVLKVR